MKHEIYALLGMVLCGALLALIFDFRRGAQKAARMPDAAVIIADFLYWIICAAAVAAMIWKLNDGIIRIYEFIGLFLGALLYFLTLSPLVVRAVAFITGYILKIIKIIFKILLTPFLFLYKINSSIHIKLLNKKASRKSEENNNERTEGSGS